MKFCVLDYETRSEADLRKVGAFEYAMHPSTEILCIGYRLAESFEALADTTTQVWSPHLGLPFPDDLLTALRDPGTRLVAHNVPFERVITEHVLPRYL